MEKEMGEVYDGVRFDPVAAGKASSGLDTLADRLAADLAAVQQALTVVPAGADEVSGRASQTHNDVATSYLTSAQASVQEMRKLAATLRLSTARFDGMETDNAGNLGGAPQA
ncbi:PE domain-containing protein [Nocardia carnea]|uniref:PE domain-containing protein n=1 Tax=Nocardia carnea TaxID=37328 RepID=UPI002458FAA3|nr:PE domain-containing protein [Nocardia carnea]